MEGVLGFCRFKCSSYILQTPAVKSLNNIMIKIDFLVMKNSNTINNSITCGNLLLVAEGNIDMV